MHLSAFIIGFVGLSFVTATPLVARDDHLDGPCEQQDNEGHANCNHTTGSSSWILKLSAEIACYEHLTT